MGVCWGRCVKKRSNRRIFLLLIGLDNAGKTQTVNTLSGEQGNVHPTVGFKAVNLAHRNVPVTIYDLGGGSQIRDIWPQYYSEVHGVIFVIDSSDTERMQECRDVLSEVISHDRIAGKPILILANKQDKNGALDDLDIVEKLDVERLVNRYRCPCLVESYAAVARDGRKMSAGLRKGYGWLLGYITRRYGDMELRVQTDLHRRHLPNDSETGFENPNYLTLREQSRSTKSDGLSDIIVVKPLRIEVASAASSSRYDDSDFDAVKTSSVETVEEVTVKKDTTIVKCDAPIARRDMKIASAVERSSGKLDIRCRPQSSPTGKVFVVTERADSAKQAIEMKPIDSCNSRPTSASQLIRRQLEAPPQRRLSLRHPLRNKTAPLFHFEPTGARGDWDGAPASPRAVGNHTGCRD